MPFPHASVCCECGEPIKFYESRWVDKETGQEACSRTTPGDAAPLGPCYRALTAAWVERHPGSTQQDADRHGVRYHTDG